MLSNSVTVRPITMAVPLSLRPRWMPICFASSSSSSSTIRPDHLRFQLDQLHAEADTTRTKANSARLRLLRLSEAAENLQKQAALSVQKGKENEAREILFQRKKVLQALEKSKRRIELLDELSIKLCEAISLKESQLIGQVSMDIEDETEDASSPVRIITPKEEYEEDITDTDFNPNVMKFCEVQDVPLSIESQDNLMSDEETQDFRGSLNGSWNEDNKASVLTTEVSSYEALMEHIDKQLGKIEAELVTILKVSALVLDGDEKPENPRLQQTLELLQSIHGIRQRIRSTEEAKMRI